MGLDDITPNDGSGNRTIERIKIEYVDSDLDVWKATWPPKTEYAVEDTPLLAAKKLISIIENEKEESD